jgi:hypothetical protein
MMIHQSHAFPTASSDRFDEQKLDSVDYDPNSAQPALPPVA